MNSTRADSSMTSVELGGWWNQPRFSLGYARAARELFAVMQRTKKPTEIVAPICFLVRHAVELALKDILLGHDANERDQAKIDAFDQKSGTAKPLTDAVVEKIQSTHDLPKLVALVEGCVPVFVTPNWSALVELINRQENGAADRFRYERVRVKDASGTKTMVRSFERPAVIPIKQLISQMDEFMRQAAEILGPSSLPDAKERSALEDLGLEGQQLAQELYKRGLL